MSEERYSRQKDIVPAAAVADVKATVIGVGAIGRQVALQLAAIGVPWMQLIDFDVVEESNLASQGYLEIDMHKAKVEATGDLCHRVNNALNVVMVNDRFRRGMEIGNAIFCCVDKIDTRRVIWNAVNGTVQFFTDGRMSAEVLRVITACDPTGIAHYPTTLFAANEAYVGACTAKSTVFCANIAAGLMVAQFAKYLRRLPVDVDLQLNLLAGELTVAA